MRYRLLDVCELANDKIETTYLNKHNYISTENMLPNKGGIEIASSLPKAFRVRAFRKKDVLVSNIRPYFKKIWYADRDGGCSSDVLVFRAKECIRPQYLYYLLSENVFFSYAMSTAKGTKMPRGDKKALMKYSLSGFPLDYQDKIVNVLKPLDDKININTKINKNLEQQAQAIYMDMFITNAEPSWPIGRLSNLITVKYGKDHKMLADGAYPVYGSGGIIRYVDRPLYDKESVLIPRKGTLNNVMYVNEPFWSVDTMFFTEMKQDNIAKFVFHFVKSKDLTLLNTGSAVPSMTTDILNSMELHIPDTNSLRKFESIVAPIYLSMQHNTKEDDKLALLRDTLLPRLMSGELDVSDIEL